MQCYLGSHGWTRNFMVDKFIHYIIFVVWLTGGQFHE